MLEIPEKPVEDWKLIVKVFLSSERAVETSTPLAVVVTRLVTDTNGTAVGLAFFSSGVLKPGSLSVFKEVDCGAGV